MHSGCHSTFLDSYVINLSNLVNLLLGTGRSNFTCGIYLNDKFPGSEIVIDKYEKYCSTCISKIFNSIFPLC